MGNIINFILMFGLGLGIPLFFLEKHEKEIRLNNVLQACQRFERDGQIKFSPSMRETCAYHIAHRDKKE